MFNFHTHCHYCDGKGTPKDFITEAVSQKFTALGFSSHAPLPFENVFTLKEEDLPAYVDEIRRLQGEYAGQIAIFAGLECDYIPNTSRSFDALQQSSSLDYIIGGIHIINHEEQLWFIDGPTTFMYDEGLEQIFQSDIKRAVRQYFYQLYEMIETEKFDVVAHVDKIKMNNKNRYFREDEKWYRDYIEETIRLIKEKSLIVEINTRGIYKKRSDTFYPSPWVIKILKDFNIPVIISSDAHQKDELSLYFDEAKHCLASCGYKEVSVLTTSGWNTTPIFSVATPTGNKSM
jgi:histidinol-phosphatase (PHP family)